MAIAHNAAFDMSVIRATCETYGLACPDLDFLCTMKAAQAAWPELGTARLNKLCEHLGIELDHHRAGSDAFGCGMISVEIARAAECRDFVEASSRFGLAPSRLARF